MGFEFYLFLVPARKGILHDHHEEMLEKNTDNDA